MKAMTSRPVLGILIGLFVGICGFGNCEDVPQKDIRIWWVSGAALSKTEINSPKGRYMLTVKLGISSLDSNWVNNLSDGSWEGRGSEGTLFIKIWMLPKDTGPQNYSHRGAVTDRALAVIAAGDDFDRFLRGCSFRLKGETSWLTLSELIALEHDSDRYWIRICLRCGAVLKKGVDACPACGAQLRREQVVEPIASPNAAPPHR